MDKKQKLKFLDGEAQGVETMLLGNEIMLRGLRSMSLQSGKDQMKVAQELQKSEAVRENLLLKQRIIAELRQEVAKDEFAY